MDLANAVEFFLFCFVCLFVCFELVKEFVLVTSNWVRRTQKNPFRNCDIRLMAMGGSLSALLFTCLSTDSKFLRV